MSKLRVVLSLLAIASFGSRATAQNPFQAPPPTAVDPPTEAEQALDEALAKVEALGSVRADIRQDVTMLGQEFTVRGSYSQTGPYTFLLDLEVEGLPEASGRMRQVSDGEVLHDFQQILDQRYYFRLELPEALARLNQAPFEEVHREYIIRQQMGLTGPSALLDGLRQGVSFDRKTAGKLDGRPVWILRGRWKDLAAFGLGPFASVPAYMPSVVEVQVDQETGWPYRVLLLGARRSSLRKANAPTIDPATGRPIGNVAADEEPPSRFLLSYENVEFDPEIDPTLFIFRVPDADRDRVRDRTPEMLSMIDQAARGIEIAKQQDAAAGAESTGDVLEDVIQIPSPEPEPTPVAPPAGLDAVNPSGR